MNKKVIYIDNLKGLKQAEKMQILGWIPLHNGFFNFLAIDSAKLVLLLQVTSFIYFLIPFIDITERHLP